jgi:hypothetical protein
MYVLALKDPLNVLKGLILVCFSTGFGTPKEKLW